MRGGSEHRETTGYRGKDRDIGIDGGRFHLTAGRGWDIEPWFQQQANQNWGMRDRFQRLFQTPSHFTGLW